MIFLQRILRFIQYFLDILTYDLQPQHTSIEHEYTFGSRQKICRFSNLANPFFYQFHRDSRI